MHDTFAGLSGSEKCRLESARRIELIMRKIRLLLDRESNVLKLLKPNKWFAEKLQKLARELLI